MAKIIIVMISRLRTDPPFLAMSVAQVKKKKNLQKNTLMLARRTDLWEWGATHPEFRPVP